jgi:hypothetical protein
MNGACRCLMYSLFLCSQSVHSFSSSFSLPSKADGWQVVDGEVCGTGLTMISLRN